MTGIERSDSDGQALLAAVFDFSSSDIAANRAGSFSQEQKQRMLSTHHRNSRFAWIAFGLIFGLGLVGFSAETIRNDEMGAESLLAYFALTAFFGGVVWMGILYFRRQMKRTLGKGKVKSVQGTIQVVGMRIEKLTHWYFCVGNRKFRIDRSDHRVRLQQSDLVGRDALVFYSSPWKGVLSVVVEPESRQTPCGVLIDRKVTSP